ncbi:hypothetical protein CGLO_12258 [Colletotrichum gloeosporioides Cg-14]|uniref:Uncharacterized protein n=1 Tax=Colletotrichum gloeosporioides (strain Cg-14) TaxID=1237896 RepID=T0LK03_COLGC|nr:hypothetical protein CGLO_12258 [Colletotrichum gloeosporioides Cg-14]
MCHCQRPPFFLSQLPGVSGSPPNTRDVAGIAADRCGQGGSIGGTQRSLRVSADGLLLLLLGCLSAAPTRTLVQVGRDFRPGGDESPHSGFRRRR